MDGTPERKRRWGEGRRAFLAHAEAIRKELAKGRSMAAIHDDYQDRLGVCYAQFTRYVKARLKREAGPVAQGGKAFQDMKIYKRHKERIAGLAPLPDWTYAGTNSSAAPALANSNAQGARE